MKPTKALSGGGERVAQRLCQPVPRRLQRRGPDVDRLDVDTVDPVGPLTERGVAAGADVGDDLAHGVARADLAMKELLQALHACRIDIGRREAITATLVDDRSKARRIEARKFDAHAAPAVARSVAAR